MDEITVLSRMSNAIEAAHHVQCPTTQWTAVIQALQSTDQEKAIAALNVFCEQYRDVIFKFFLRRVGPDLADTYTQEFFFKKIHRLWEERNGLLFNVERQEGAKFRYFLISALQWFALDMKKTGQDPLKDSIPELPDLADRNNQDIARDCDREVALGLIHRVMQRLQVSGVYLRYFCSQISAEQGAGELAISPGAFRVAVHRLVPAIRDAFRDEVRALVASDADVEGEIKYLVKIIAETVT
jgi:RNA polymerase sigma-70 factor (ECF subfamily)